MTFWSEPFTTHVDLDCILPSQYNAIYTRYHSHKQVFGPGIITMKACTCIYYHLIFFKFVPVLDNEVLSASIRLMQNSRKTNINAMFIGRRKMGIFLLMERLINLIKPYKDLPNFQSILYDRRRMTKIHLLTSVVIACQQSFYVGKLPRFNCLCSPI